MDIVHDRGRTQLLGIVERHPMPAWAGTAEIVATEKQADVLDDGMFADSDHRYFPLATAGDVWLSAAYFKQAKASMPRVLADFIEQRICKAAAIHDCLADVTAVLNYTATEKVAAEASEENFADVSVVSGVKTFGYPIFDQTGVKLACDRLLASRDNMPFSRVCSIADGICKIAARLSAPVYDTVMKLAGLGVIDRIALFDNLYYRAKKLHNTDMGDSMAKLASYVIDCPAEELNKQSAALMSMVDSFDTASAIHYSDGYVRPEDLVYALTVKQATDMLSDSVSLGSMVFNLRKLAALPAETYAVLGDDFVEDIKEADGQTSYKKLADVLPTLPLPDRQLLEKHLINVYG